MSDKTLGKARGLNSIADPKSFKGSAGRGRVAEPKPSPPTPSRPRVEPQDRGESRRPAPPEPPPAERAPPPGEDDEVGQPAQTGSSPVADADEPAPKPVVEPAPVAQPHRAVTPGIQRKRRELSVPHVLAEALERTGINPADIVMAGYRKHGDAIYAGSGGRMLAKGRTRLRLSISDIEFEQLTRLGQARGWNRSETVSVILAMELMAPSEPAPPSS